MARTPDQTYTTLFLGTYNIYGTNMNEEGREEIMNFIKERIPNYLKTDPSIVATAYALTQIKAKPGDKDFSDELEQKVINLQCTKKLDKDTPVIFDVIRLYRMLL